MNSAVEDVTRQLDSHSKRAFFLSLALSLSLFRRNYFPPRKNVKLTALNVPRSAARDGRKGTLVGESRCENVQNRRFARHSGSYPFSLTDHPFILTVASPFRLCKCPESPFGVADKNSASASSGIMRVNLE